MRDRFVDAAFGVVLLGSGLGCAIIVLFLDLSDGVPMLLRIGFSVAGFSVSGFCIALSGTAFRDAYTGHA